MFKYFNIRLQSNSIGCDLLFFQIFSVESILFSCHPFKKWTKPRFWHLFLHTFPLCPDDALSIHPLPASGRQGTSGAILGHDPRLHTIRLQREDEEVIFGTRGFLSFPAVFWAHSYFCGTADFYLCFFKQLFSLHIFLF